MLGASEDQYMFGADMLVAPVVLIMKTPVNGKYTCRKERCGP